MQSFLASRKLLGLIHCTGQRSDRTDGEKRFSEIASLQSYNTKQTSSSENKSLWHRQPLTKFSFSLKRLS